VKTIVPLLRDVAGDRDLLTRLIAVQTLGEMGAEDRVVPMLTQALEDRDVSVRLLAIEGLARGGDAAIAPLVEALSAKSARVRLGVARALGMMGPAAKKAEPALGKLTKDPDPAVRAAAEEALRQVGGGKG
jgi:HEAT repeat protein